MPKNSSTLDTVLRFPVTTIKDISITAVCYKDGVSGETPVRKVSLFEISAPQKFYVNNFNTTTNDFVGNGFFDNQQFPDLLITLYIPLIHISNNTNFIYMLKTPIIVADTNATLKYEDVVIVEPGEIGSVFGTPEFYDYVVVEGSRDGFEWIPIEDGYDSSIEPIWLNAFNNKANGTYSMYKPHTLNLRNKFAKGEKIFIRFRLYADAGTTGWGWAIDNLMIQDQFVGVNEDNKHIPSSFALNQNYPNPFNPSTIISYSVPKASKVSIKIFDILGKEVSVLVNEIKSPGNYRVTFDASKLASGTYFCRMDTEGFSDTKKLMFVK